MTNGQIQEAIQPLFAAIETEFGDHSTSIVGGNIQLHLSLKQGFNLLLHIHQEKDFPDIKANLVKYYSQFPNCERFMRLSGIITPEAIG